MFYFVIIRHNAIKTQKILLWRLKIMFVVRCFMFIVYCLVIYKNLEKKCKNYFQAKKKKNHHCPYD